MDAERAQRPIDLTFGCSPSWRTRLLPQGKLATSNVILLSFQTQKIRHLPTEDPETTSSTHFRETADSQEKRVTKLRYRVT